MIKIKLITSGNNIHNVYTHKSFENYVEDVVNTNGYVLTESFTKKKSWVNTKHIESITLEEDND